MNIQDHIITHIREFLHLNKCLGECQKGKKKKTLWYSVENKCDSFSFLLHLK